METLSTFRECYNRWAGWIGFETANIPKNSIWHQCTEIMNNEFMFQALYLTGREAANQPDFHSYLAANGVLYRYLLNGYLSFQYLAIRRLIESSPKDAEKKFRGVISIRRLLDDMKNNSIFITRETFVCVDGLPYDYSEELQREEDEALAADCEYSIWAGWQKEPGIGTKSKQRHRIFDRLSGIDEDYRQPTDSIAPDYWQQFYTELGETKLRRIKNYVDKYLAHAADPESIATLDDEDKNQSIQYIQSVQNCLFGIVQRLTFDFYGASYAMAPTDGENQLLYNFSKPFVSAEVVAQTNKELQQKIRDRLA
jgi:hypothetical protein